MHFAYGWSRWVLLIGNIAIKVPRLRPFRWISRFFFWKCKGKVRERLVMQFKSHPLIGAWRYLGHGVIANIIEYRIYQKFPDLPVAPTLFSFFGLINIQVRGNPIKRTPSSDCPFRIFSKLYPDCGDLVDIKNFAEIDGRIVLIDCGSRKFEQILETHKEQMPTFLLLDTV